MIIGSCGFSWSGSSAIIDLLKEYDEVDVYDDIEFILAFYPDGLNDLDTHLNTASYKHLSSCVAIPRFKKAASVLLRKVTNGQIERITEDYLNNITQVKWIGKGQGQLLLHNRFIYEYFGMNFTFKLLRRLPKKFCTYFRLYPLSEMRMSIEPDGFDKFTRQYTSNILKSLGLDLSKKIVLDQPFAGNNPEPCLKYYDDAKAIVVDRDPRDMYLIAKHFFSKTSYQIPCDNVQQYIEYYKQQHKYIKNFNSHSVLYLRFEDLVYDYENTVKKIEDFCGLEKHNKPRTCFVPEKSMVNTRLFERIDKYQEDIEAISIELSDFLFDFNSFSCLFDSVDSTQKIFDDNPLSIEYRHRVEKSDE